MPFAGFVTQFEIDRASAERYPVQIAGGRPHEELWVPAEELSEFNAHIVGTIAVVEAFTGERFTGQLHPETLLPVGLLDVPDR